MRHSLTVLLVTAVITLAASVAWASNQDVADQIKQGIEDSGQTRNCKIAVKVQNGTAFLAGQVQNKEQASAALKTAIGTPGVERVVNNIVVGAANPTEPAARQPSRLPASPQATPTYQATDTATPSPTMTPQPQRAHSDEVVPRPESSGVAQRMEAAAASRTSRVAARAPSANNRSEVRQAGAVEAQYQPEEAPRAMNPYGHMPQPQPLPIATGYMQRGPAPMGGDAPQGGQPMPMYSAAAGQGGVAPVRYDRPCLPNYAWPSYSAYPNYASVTYPKQYSPTAWPYIGPFYPYPQVPLGWRKVSLEWDDGWWMLDFKDRPSSWEGPLGRWY